MGDHFGKLGAVRSFWFCREDQPGLGLGLRSHNSGGTVFSLKKFFPPTPNQFVGVSASRTFLSPFTKGTRVLALVIRFLHFCAHSMGIHYTKQTSTSPHLHSLPISANFTLISTKSGFSDTFSPPPPPPPPGCVCAWGVRLWDFSVACLCVCGADFCATPTKNPARGRWCVPKIHIFSLAIQIQRPRAAILTPFGPF